jgi:sn-glycerol 3-phosphate transport system substrate-binding protein
MKIAFRILALLILTSMLLSACAPATEAPKAVQPTQAASAATAKPTDAPKPASGSKIELQFWTLLGGANADRIQAIVDEFNKSQDKIVVTNEKQGGYDDLQQKLLASIVAGKPPVITMVDYKYVPYYAQQGVFEPIDNLWTEEDKKDFIPGLLTDLTFRGKVYAVPFNRSTQGIFYNKDLMKEIGLDPEKPPETFDQIVAYSKLLQEKKGKNFWAAFGSEGNWQWMFEPLLAAWGGKVNDDNCNFTFNDEKGVAMAKFFQDNIYKDKLFGIAANPSAPNFSDSAFEFVNGQVLFTRSSTALQGSMGSTVKFNWGFAMFPAGPAGRVVTSGGANIAITAKSTTEQKKAAWEFVRFATDTKHSATFHMQTGYMPSRYSVTKLPEVQEFYKKNPSWLVSVNQLDFVKPTACGVLNAPEWASVMQAAMDRVTLKNEDPKKVLDQAAAELQKTIDKARAENKLIK